MTTREGGGARVLQVRNVCLEVGGKKILENISATATSGSMLAVMGPSGSGKTSLMNLICGRNPPEAAASGQVLVDGQPVNSRLRKSLGYVTQEDVFFPQLSLSQTLWFYSQVKLPGRLTAAEKKSRVEEVVELLELRKCLPTKLGDTSSKGLSGGEKKRANIACELLRRPQILLLDEPTSGLDASLALKVVEILGRWSTEMNSIVIASIHQPSSQTFHQFRQLLLLVEGHLAYRGDLREMSQYFRSIGVTFCSDWNAADSMLEAVKESSPHKELIISSGEQFGQEPLEESHVHVNLGFDGASKEEVNGSVEAGGFSGDSYAVTVQEPKSTAATAAAAATEADSPSWWLQFLALCFRGFIVSKDSILSIHVVVQSAFLATVASIIWFQLARKEENLTDFMAAIFFITSYMVFAPFFDAIMTFYTDLQVVKHERKSGMYRIGAYYLSKMVVDVPLLLVMPLFTLTPIFWAVGFGQFHVYLPFIAVVTLNSLASQGIGVAFSLFTEQPRTNMTFAFIFMIFCFLTGGFFSTKIPAWFDWSKYLSYMRYCYHFAVIITFQNSENFTCSVTFPSTYDSCVGNSTDAGISGHEILQHHPDTLLPQWVNVLVAFGLFFGFRLFGYALLRFVRKV